MMLFLPFVSANVEITEIMHSPTQTESDTDGEWVEIHNAGEESIDISEWKLDGYNFDDTAIESGEYIVIARELLDGTDADLESFEGYWGDGNGVWDEEYKAVDGYFSLSDEDTVVLTDELGEIMMVRESLADHAPLLS